MASFDAWCCVDVPRLDPYERVLRAQRLLIDLQDRVVLSRRAVGQDLAALAKALGGGWSEQPPAAAGPAKG